MTGWPILKGQKYPQAPNFQWGSKLLKSVQRFRLWMVNNCLRKNRKPIELEVESELWAAMYITFLNRRSVNAQVEKAQSSLVSSRSHWIPCLSATFLPKSLQYVKGWKWKVWNEWWIIFFLFSCHNHSSFTQYTLHSELKGIYIPFNLKKS